MQKTKITLKKLGINYFKGIKSLTIDFSDKTTIYGDNGTYKSTVVDAFSWLLFGKNSNGESDTNFSIKTLDKNNNPISKVEHSVEGVLDVNGSDVVAKRVLKENWVKSRGSIHSELKGNKTTYFWNKVPKTQKEYQENINDLINETVFKLITDPLAFNNLHWEKQREIIYVIGGGVSNEETAKGNNDFEYLLNKLNGKDLQDYKKQLASQRKKLNEELSFIPTRIDEVEKGKPETLDFDSIELKIKDLTGQIQKIDLQIEDRNKAIEESSKKTESLHNDINSLKSENQNIERDIDNEIRDSIHNANKIYNDTVNKLSLKELDSENNFSKIKSLEIDVDSLDNQISDLEKKIEDKREEWKKENSTELTFTEGSFNCPTCSNPLDEKNIEEEKKKMQEDFDTDKSNQLLKINKEGKKLSDILNDKKINFSNKKNQLIEVVSFKEDFEKSIIELKDKVKGLESNKTDSNEETIKAIVSDKITSSSKYQENLKSISLLESKFSKKTDSDISYLKEQKNELTKEVDPLKSLILNKDRIKESNDRISELEKEENKLAVEISNIEKDQFLVQNFIKHQISNLEKKINSKFKHVKFKMFETLMNGSELETCKALVNGVPFSDANTASKINYGIDIINTLCKHYNITAPLFLDNRESVTKLIDTDSQVINLIVSEEDKKLRIE